MSFIQEIRYSILQVHIMKDIPLLCYCIAWKIALWDGRPCQLLGELGWTLRCSQIISSFSLEVPDWGRPEYFLFKLKTVPPILNLKDVSSYGWRWRSGGRGGGFGNLFPNFCFTSLMLWQSLQVQIRKLCLPCLSCI